MSLSMGPTLNVGSRAAIPSVLEVIKTLTKPYTSHHHHHNKKTTCKQTLPHLNPKSLTLSSTKPSHSIKKTSISYQILKTNRFDLESSKKRPGGIEGERRGLLAFNKTTRESDGIEDSATAFKFEELDFVVCGWRESEKRETSRESEACLVLMRVEWRVRGDQFN